MPACGLLDRRPVPLPGSRGIRLRPTPKRAENKHSGLVCSPFSRIPPCPPRAGPVIGLMTSGQRKISSGRLRTSVITFARINSLWC